MIPETAYLDIACSPAELCAALDRMGIPRGDGVPEAQTLAGGVSSNILKVRVGDSLYCVKQALPKLKVEKDWYAPVARVYAEIAWLRTAQSIVPGHVPRVIGVDKPSGSFVMEYLADSDYANWKTRLLAGRIEPHVAVAVGDMLGRIHQATAGQQGVAETFRTDADFFSLRLEPYLVETARQHPDLAVELLALIHATQQNRIALVHGDVSPKNILIGPLGPVLLDAECAWYGDPAFDVAFVLNHLLLKIVHLPRHADALADSFAALLGAYRDQVRWEPVDPMIGRVGRLLSALLLARVDGKSPAEYLNEASRERIRLVARQAMSDRLASPEALLERLLVHC